MTSSTINKEKIISFISKGLLSVLAVAVIGFIGLKLYPLIHGPDVTIATLSNGSTLQDPMIRISGKALYTKNLIVNGDSIALAPDGSFDENLVLNPGYNVIVAQAVDRFGKLQTHNYAVVLHSSNENALSLNGPIQTSTN